MTDLNDEFHFNINGHFVDEFVHPDQLSAEARAVYDSSPSPIWLRLGDHWILDDDLKPVRAPMVEWSLWFEKQRNERILRRSHLGVYLISTVFLGLDHSFGRGAPILWETMVFDERGRRRRRDAPEPDGLQWRYRTIEEATAGHSRAEAYVQLFRHGAPRKLKKFLRRGYGKPGGRVLARRYAGVLDQLEPADPE